jgi:hypothetical protein
MSKNKSSQPALELGKVDTAQKGSGLSRFGLLKRGKYQVMGVFHDSFCDQQIGPTFLNHASCKFNLVSGLTESFSLHGREFPHSSHGIQTKSGHYSSFE